jgi:hypothetical protein
MKHIPERDYPDRSDMIMLNDNFKELEESFGVEMEYINVGKEPNDASGDLLRDAMQKVNRNFKRIEILNGK